VRYVSRWERSICWWGSSRGERWEHLLSSCSAVAAGANDYGPTRKLGRGLSNFFLGPAEVFVTVTTVNTYDGNAAAAGYGVVRGVGRSATRHIAGFLEIVLWPFPHGAKVTIHYSRVIFLGFTLAIQNFRPSSATNRNIPTCAIIRKDRRACLS
jgi:putative exosortase-associated protein (TIGR04073 family)